jgi:hypothetical protein
VGAGARIIIFEEEQNMKTRQLLVASDVVAAIVVDALSALVGLYL